MDSMNFLYSFLTNALIPLKGGENRVDSSDAFYTQLMLEYLLIVNFSVKSDWQKL